MAITITAVAPPVQQPSLQTEGIKAQLVQFTYSGTYVTGGDTLTAAQLGLTSMAGAHLFCDTVGGSLSATTTFIAQFNEATGKLQIWGEDGTGASAGLALVEAASGATLTGLKINILAIGV